jgi:hypothetical protein
MATFYDRWSHAKGDFEKSKALFPPPMLAKLNKGAGLGPALKTLDRADGYESKAKALMAVRTAKEWYDKELRSAMNAIPKKDSAAFKALDRLEKTLQTIWLEADKSSQKPRPSGSTVPHEVVRSFNLANGFKPKYLDVKATQVDVVILVDKTLDELIANGQESLKLNYLGEVAKEELKHVGNAFAKTMAEIDAKVHKLDSAGREAKIKEANEALKHYSQIIEDRITKAVAKEWQGYLDRKQYLRDFRLKCVAKITLGAVAVGVSTASAVASFGALWMNVAAAVKAMTDIAQTIKTWAEDLETVYARLVQDVDQIHTLNQQREKAKKEGKSQAGSKLKEVGKELATGVLPITKNMISSASSVEQRAEQLLGLVSKLENRADLLTGQLHATIKLMGKLPEKQMNEAMKKDAEKLQATFEKMFADITDLHQKSQRCAKFGERALLAVQKLRVEDLWTGAAAAEGTGAGAKGVALYAAINFAVEVAKHGTTLLSLL